MRRAARPGRTGRRGRGRVAPLAVAGVAAVVAAALVVGVLAATRADRGGPGVAAAPARAAPDPDRPDVSLSFDVADDLRTVSGRERVVFTPDAGVCELVFRAWPNAPVSVAAGSSLTVSSAAVDGVPTRVDVTAAGAPAGAPGTLVTLALPGCRAAGTPVVADLAFTVRLGADADDRLGVSPATRTAWFGTAFPLLAWIRGEGWSREPAGTIAGEYAASEQFRLRALDVTAPAGAAVAGVGRAVATAPGPRPGTTRHTFTADAVRDVAVAVGRYTVTERTVGPGGTRLHLLTPVGGRVDPADLAGRVDAMLGRLVPRLGALPHEDLWVAVAPGQSSGIEFPGALQLGDDTPRGERDELVAHELAHQWFYDLVGNDQGRDPWIDEAFATAQASLAVGDDGEYGGDDVRPRLRGELGLPMTTWDRFDTYESAVYVQGAAALLEARREVGPEAFDGAVRAYLARDAHRVVGPDDVRTAFADLPPVIDRLSGAGAFRRTPS